MPVSFLYVLEYRYTKYAFLKLNFKKLFYFILFSFKKNKKNKKIKRIYLYTFLNQSQKITESMKISIWFIVTTGHHDTMTVVDLFGHYHDK